MTSSPREVGPWFHAKVLYPAAIWARGEGALFRHLRELTEIQWLPAEQLVRRRDARIARILRYARAHSRYYRELWPDRDPVSAEDAAAYLAELPLLTKSQLQTWAAYLKAQPPVRPVSRKTTGGSTGQPVTVLKDRASTGYERAVMWLGYGWFGVKVGDRVARFWGSPFAARRRIQSTLADVVMHRIHFSAFAFNEADLEEYWQRCLRFRPHYLHGYVSMLEAFARFLQSRHYEATALGLKSVIGTSEVLTPPQRAILESTFGAPVQTEYGCGEVGPIAYECDRGSLHLMTENVAVEILNAEGRAADVGETGEVVVTDLHNRAMPLVRYRLGDFAVPGRACSCGRGFPVIQKIWGREYDFVQGPDGRKYHGEFFMYLFEDLRRVGSPVRQFQVTQRGPNVLDVEVVIPGELSEGQETRIRHHVGNQLKSMKIDVRRVDAIARAQSGKMQVIRNTWLRPTDRAADSEQSPVG